MIMPAPASGRPRTCKRSTSLGGRSAQGRITSSTTRWSPSTFGTTVSRPEPLPDPSRSRQATDVTG
jgi:hypothetical protein